MTAPPFTLRPATEDDFPFMRDTKLDGLEPYVRALWGWNRSEQERKARDEFDPAGRWIVVWDGVDAGYVHIERQADVVTLAGIYLVPPMRRRGLGAAVIQRVMDGARAEGKPVALRVLKPNPARRLYERLGFRVVGETQERYFMRSD
ncbi:MAG TPA: GNAT family N-acetyltransferase [Vicinamibacterales bacterium]|nr:GNAT family N-acetyltransferase [Vicinamibacterales bacterium]